MRSQRSVIKEVLKKKKKEKPYNRDSDWVHWPQSPSSWIQYGAAHPWGFQVPWDYGVGGALRGWVDFWLCLAFPEESEVRTTRARCREQGPAGGAPFSSPSAQRVCLRSSPEPPERDSTVAVIVGASVGGFLAVVILVLMVVKCVRRKKEQKLSTDDLKTEEEGKTDGEGNADDAK